MWLHHILRNKKNIFCLRHFYRNVCVRFAPSPTGNIHLGGLRTALYNYLFTKKNNGKFLLRIEDTDQSRVVSGAAENLERILNLNGLVPDEGPNQAGRNGPYIQSQRLGIYQSKIKDLLDQGSAYKCFCSESRLDIIRKEALKMRETPRYDNKCRSLSEKELEKLERDKTPYCVRFKLEDGPVTFKDLVFGEVTITLAEGDPVILKTDGYPTYHFACVVDDHLMEVTHVLRGVEWQVSTPKHLMMYKAFGWTPPIFAHLPLLLNKDGTKISKRHGDIDIESIVNKGYYPEAIINLLASNGGGFGKIYDDLPTLNLQEMIEKFDFSKVNTNSGKIDLDKLNYFNRNCLLKQIENPEGRENLIASVMKTLQNHFGSNKIDIKAESLERIVLWSVSKKRICNINELLNPLHAFLWTTPQIESILLQEVDGIALQVAITTLDKVSEGDFVQELLTSLFKEVAKEHNLIYNDFMKLLRLVLSAKKVGPSVAEMLEMLGKAEAINRLKQGVIIALKIKI